jgi:hypothetical protein
MSVDPVHNSSPGIERTTPEQKPHTTPALRTHEPVNESAGTSAKVEISRPNNIPAPLAIPEHEVKVVLDTPDNNTLVYQVLNKQSGEVILQVPSADQLRGIHDSQELLQRIAARSTEPASVENSLPPVKTGGNDHGNKL